MIGREFKKENSKFVDNKDFNNKLTSNIDNALNLPSQSANLVMIEEESKEIKTNKSDENKKLISYIHNEPKNKAGS